MLSLLRLELNIHVKPYDLTPTAESIAISLPQIDDGRAAYNALVLLRKELGHHGKPYELSLSPGRQKVAISNILRLRDTAIGSFDAHLVDDARDGGPVTAN